MQFRRSKIKVFSAFSLTQPVLSIKVMNTLKMAVVRCTMDIVSITQGICTPRGTALEQCVLRNITINADG